MAFIGDGRLLVAKQVGGPYAQVGEAPVLVLLDTSNLVEFPAVPRQVRFVCDPRYRNMRVRVLAEAGYSDFSGVIGGDVPFYPDPSQRVLALLFYMREDASGASNKAQGICVVRSETLLRLAEEIGEGVVGWEVWGKFTVAPDTDEVPGANEHTKYSVSESRFMRVDSNGARRWAKVRVYDLSHWSRQHPDTELPDGGEGSGEGRVRCRLTEAVLELPENVWNICHAAMLRNSIVFFSVGLSALCFGLRFFDGYPHSSVIGMVCGVPKHGELWIFGVSGEATFVGRCHFGRTVLVTMLYSTMHEC